MTQAQKYLLCSCHQTYKGLQSKGPFSPLLLHQKLWDRVWTSDQKLTDSF